MLLHVGSVIEPLAAYCEAMRGYVAALVILTEVDRCWQQCAGGALVGYRAAGSDAMRCIRCLRIGSSLPVAGTSAVITRVSTD